MCYSGHAGQSGVAGYRTWKNEFEVIMKKYPRFTIEHEFPINGYSSEHIQVKITDTYLNKTNLIKNSNENGFDSYIEKMIIKLIQESRNERIDNILK